MKQKIELIMDIQFKDFWPGFENEPNIFLDYFEHNNHINQKLEASGISKIVFKSVFPKKTKMNRIQREYTRFKDLFSQVEEEKEQGCISIWYSGENMRPPLSHDFDAYLSFDLDSFGERNVYFPLIFLSMNPYQLNVQKRLGIDYCSEILLQRRVLNPKKNSKSICIIAGKHPIRTAVVEEFQKYFQVDVFGGMSNAPVNEKHSVAKNYQYMLCLENDLYPGYVTEKLVEAYVCETIPLYWGNTEGNFYLNSQSFSNLCDFKDIATWAKYVDSISEPKYREIYEQPLLLSEPPIQLHLTKLFEFILRRKQFERKNTQEL